MMKSFELRLFEGVQLMRELEDALAKERGGGTPLTRNEYLSLRELVLEWIKRNEPATY